MSILYLAEQGSKVSKEGNRVLIRKDEILLLDVSLFKIDTVVVLGNVQFSTQAMGDILTKGIDIAFLTIQGRLKGRVESYKSRNVPLKIRQYEAHKDHVEKLALAKVFITAKAGNAIQLLKSYNYRDKEIGLEDDIKEMERKSALIQDKTDIEGLMGTEGYIARVYFTGFMKIVNRDRIVMEKREQRGSFSYVNQMLSLGYICVMNEIMGLLNAAGLDPHIGFLHSLDYGRPSLALDMLEEYRQPVIDRFTMNLVNKCTIITDDFEAKEEGMRLTQDGIKKYFKFYEEWMKEPVREYRGAKTSFRDIMQKQAGGFAASLRDKKQYTPYMMKD